MAKSQERLTAATERLAAIDAFVSAVKLEASSNLQAAYEAVLIVRAKMEKLMTLYHPWNEREQRELDNILRDPASIEARDRVHQVLGWHKATINSISAHHDNGLESAARSERVKNYRRMVSALADIALPPGRDRTLKALSHLKKNYPDLWKVAEGKTKTSSWRTQISKSQELRANNMASNIRGRTPSDVKRDG